jgi:glycosyltransferase involved in cell wall biosynthesis
MREEAVMPDRAPRVSVCVPTYNYGRYLRSSVRSVLDQTFTDWELVVCDNASTDDTEAVMREFTDPRIRYHRYRINVPMIYNFNRPLELARGEYMLLLCADDMLTPTQLELLVESLDAHPTAGLAVARNQQIIDDAGAAVGPVRKHALGPGLVRGADIVAAECGSAGLIVGLPPQVLARTAAVLEQSGFDPAANHTADNDLFLKICAKWDAVYVDAATFHYRWHAGMGTETNRRSMADIRSDYHVFSRLFRESPVLKGNRRLKRTYVKQRLYPWFWRALAKATRGELADAAWILSRIAAFAPVPWWVPYYVYRYARDRAALLARQMRGTRTASHRPAVG